MDLDWPDPEGCRKAGGICSNIDTVGFFPLHKEQLTQNWSGQGESDCLIKTKLCDGWKRR